MSLLGLDVGSTNCKGAVYSADGRCLARASREVSLLLPRPGWVELDSQRMVAATFEIIRDLAVAAQALGDAVAAISISALGESVTPVSKDGTILGNAIHHSDMRGGTEIDEFKQILPAEEIYRVNANIVSRAYTLPKLLWTRKHETRLYHAADRFLFFSDLILLKLGCEPVTSYSQASRSLLLDLRKENWSEEILSRAGMDQRQLPRLVPSGFVAGEVRSDVAADLGLGKNVKCVVGGHDQCCNALGVGICAAGKAVDGIGTVECITPVYAGIPDLNPMLQARLNVEHHVIPGLYVSFIYNQAGSLVKWFRNTFAANDPVAGGDVYDRLMAEVPAGPSSLLVLPHFEPTGSPTFIEDSAGVILGLRTSTQRGEILKAIMEGETFYFLECFETLTRLGVDTSRFIASGGGAKSAQWLQLKADIMGVPFERTTESEAGVLGAVMIAAKAIGECSTYQEACGQFVRSNRIFEPNAERHQIYAEKFSSYREMYPRLADVLRRESVHHGAGGDRHPRKAGLAEGDAPKLFERLDSRSAPERKSALRDLRDLEIQGKLRRALGPALPSYVHMHTTISYGFDIPGVFSVAHMVWAAHEARTSTALMIEHESMAHLQEAEEAVAIVNHGMEKSMGLILGVEFKAPLSLDDPEAQFLSSQLEKFWGQGEAAWVVGIGAKPSPGLTGLITQFQSAKRERALAQLNKLNQYFNIFPHLELDELMTPEGNITDRSICVSVARAKCPTAAAGEIVQQAGVVRRLMNPDGPAYVPYSRELPTYQELIVKLLELNLLPVFTAQLRGAAMSAVLPTLIKWGIKGLDLAGVEPYEANAEKEIRHFIELAGRNELLVLGGSDYRGAGTGWVNSAPWMNDPAIKSSLIKLSGRGLPEIARI